MNCPRCGHPVSSVEKTTRRNECVVRTRQCFRCRSEWKTIESVDDRTADIFDAMDRVERVLKTAIDTMQRVL